MNPWLIIIVCILVLIVLYVIITFNSLVKLKNNTEEAFATMDVYLKKRWDLIPNLVEIVKGYSKYEKSAIESIIKLRNISYNDMTNEQKIYANKTLSNDLSKLFVLAEAYPDLKANSNFLSLQESLEKIETDIAQSRKYYNATIKEYNIKVSVIPSTLVAKMFGYKKKSMYEINNEEKDNVKIDM